MAEGDWTIGLMAVATYRGGTEPAKCAAEQIVSAINNHDALVFALIELYQSFEFCVGKNTPVAIEAKRVLDVVGASGKS